MLPTPERQVCSADTYPRKAYCIIRSSQTQAEHQFSAGCYFYTQKRVDFDTFNTRKDDTMAKAKYSKNSRGEYETKIWDGTYNADGSKHRKRLVSKKSSADLERQVNQLKNDVENGQYVQGTDVTFLEYARSWLLTKKAAREMNTRKMYENIIETHLSFLEDVRLCDIRNSHFQLAINNALDKPRTCEQIEVTFKQIMKMAVADNYIGIGMYDKICADINLSLIHI